MFNDSVDSLAALLGDRRAAVSVLARFDLQDLRDASLDDLQQVAGIGTKKATRVRAAFDLARCWSQAPSQDRPLVGSPSAVYEILGPRLAGREQEHFMTLLLNVKNWLISEELIAIGTLTAALVHPREVFKAAIRKSAAGIIAAHSHPSGDPTPSIEDLAMTTRLIKVGRLVGIPLLDHVIIGQGRYCSLRESYGLWREAEPFSALELSGTKENES